MKDKDKSPSNQVEWVVELTPDLEEKNCASSIA